MDGLQDNYHTNYHAAVNCQLHGGHLAVQWKAAFGDDADIEYITWELAKVKNEIASLTQKQKMYERQLVAAKLENIKVKEQRERDRIQEKTRREEAAARKAEEDMKKQVIQTQKDAQERREELAAKIQKQQLILQSLQEQQKQQNNNM